MTLRESVVAYLESNRNQSVSGEQLAEMFNVSRSAIWKVIKSMRDDGYSIEAVTNKGYRLEAGCDVLSAAGMSLYKKSFSEENLHVYDEVDSTNSMAKELALKGAPHGTAVVADRQTAGRGRLGRKFISPPGSGIYLSVILRPESDLNEAMLITTAAAVAVRRAISYVTDVNAGIKWVNDIYINDKKVCGILTEAVTDFESSQVESVVVGIGINFKADPDAFPENIRDSICWIYENGIPSKTRNQLAAAVINELLEICENIHDSAILEEYKKNSIVIGKDIVYIKAGKGYPAKAIDIDEHGGLIVLDPYGEKIVLSSGEISIRW